jgi:hypothetical protein
MKKIIIENVADEMDLEIIKFAAASMAAMHYFDKVEESLTDSLATLLKKRYDPLIEAGNRAEKKKYTEELALHIKRSKGAYKSFKKNNMVLLNSLSSLRAANGVIDDRIVNSITDMLDAGVESK